MLCDIYKSKKGEELYLYVEQDAGFENVPADLLAQINAEKVVMTLTLSPQRTLARADVNKVMADIRSQGFYLQLPPPPVPSSPVTATND